MGCSGSHIQRVESGRALQASNSWQSGKSVAERSLAYSEVIEISGAETIQPKCMGRFIKSSIKPTSAHDWRPIYRNKRGKFLYYCAVRREWLVSYSFNDEEGLLMSASNGAAEFPEDSSVWEIRDGPDCWSTDYALKVTAKGDAKQVGFQSGDWVYVRSNGSSLFRQGERGIVEAVVNDDGQCKVQFEGRTDTVPVASWHLHRFPEGFSADKHHLKKNISFSLPHKKRCGSS